jgi:phospholipid/cholesterol/gamma-HCH transport system ATP-binding protein
MSLKERKSIRQEIGMLFQGSALFDSMSVEENVRFPLRMFSDLSEKEIQMRAAACLERVELSDAGTRFPSECSGGMQKRVGIARAIAMNPKYLFCDEPNSGLDPQTAIVIDQLIKEITLEYQMTTVVISHDMNSVMEASDTIHFVHEGSILWNGDRHQLMEGGVDELESFVFASDLMRQIRKKQPNA